MKDIQSQIDSFLAQFPIETHPAQSLILAAGTKTTFFYYVEQGAVKMSTTSAKGRNLILHTFFPNSFFSLFTLVSDGNNHYDFISHLPTVVRKIPQADLITFFKSEPEIMYDLQLRLIKGLVGLTKRIEQSALSTAHQQVASLLVYFAHHFAEAPNNQKFMVKITHQEMSEWLGLSRENVSIQMKQLEKNKLISIQDRYIEILDLKALTTLSSNRDIM